MFTKNQVLDHINSLPPDGTDVQQLVQTVNAYFDGHRTFKNAIDRLSCHIHNTVVKSQTKWEHQWVIAKEIIDLRTLFFDFTQVMNATTLSQVDLTQLSLDQELQQIREYEKSLTRLNGDESSVETWEDKGHFVSGLTVEQIAKIVFIDKGLLEVIQTLDIGAYVPSYLESTRQGDVDHFESIESVENLNRVPSGHYAVVTEGADKGDVYLKTADNYVYITNIVGQKGDDGKDGINGVDGKDGINGKDGAKGDTGCVFTPTVTNKGIMSWQNDGNLPNPETVDLLTPVLEAVYKRLYPVGAYYMSDDPTDPSELFGGTWERIKDRFILASGDVYKQGDVGGEASHVLTADEMPSHTHTANSESSGGHTHTANTNSTGGHTHTRGSMNITGHVGQGYTSNGSINGGWHNHNNRGYGGGALYLEGTGYGSSCTWANYGDAGIIRFDASRNWTGSTSNGGAHSHTVTVNSNGAHTHTVTVDESGGSQAHNNMPPYLVTNVWRRTA